jgi:predicted ester cyclase
MSVEATSKTIRSYLDALVARGDFADYFTDDVSWTTVGGGQELHGRGPVRDFLIWMHTQAFNARPKIKTLVVGGGQAALEADFVGTHTGEFLGMPASGKSVQVPYCVVYDLQHESLPFAPTSPWTCSPNSSSERATPAPGTVTSNFGLLRLLRCAGRLRAATRPDRPEPLTTPSIAAGIASRLDHQGQREERSNSVPIEVGLANWTDQGTRDFCGSVQRAEGFRDLVEQAGGRVREMVSTWCWSAYR